VTTTCPKCNSDNPSDSKFCNECGTQFPEKEGVSAPPTRTIETAKEELTTGTTFAGRYQIIEELGKGGMGKVYKVVDKEIDVKVALKLIRPDISLDKKTIERFRNELKMARDIAQKNVCRMYDLNHEKGTYYLTMEYVSGEDLKNMIRMTKRLSVGTAIDVAKQVCEGLAEAHRLGIVHRDLKPGNIMIDHDGNTRIMDFGIARSVKGKGITGAGVMIGTPEYMSPEQVEGKEVDQRSDIYSLGIILYEMVAGQLPFEGDTPFTVGMKHKSETPRDPREINPNISTDLSGLILKCLEKDKESRYQSAGEVRSALTQIEKGLPTTEVKPEKSKPLTSREITVSFSVRKLWLPAVIVLAVIALGVVLWQVFFQGGAVIPLEERHSVAVIHFENQTGDKAFDYLSAAIPNLLITSLEQSRNIRVITWERLDDLLKQAGKADASHIDRDLGIELCQMGGVDNIVLGSYVKAGEMFATDVKVLDVSTKDLLKSASTRGEGVDSILKSQIDELSQEISQGLGVTERRLKVEVSPIMEVTTNSMEAYTYFLRGKSDYDKWYYDDARKFLENAIELDPSFAVAYLYLAWAQGSLGNTEARDETYKKAKLHSERATEKERLYIEAAYARRIEKDPQKRIQILEQIALKYPEEKRVYYDLGTYYRDYVSQPKAIETYNKALELDPKYGVVLNGIAYVYSDLGDYEKALEDSMAELYFRMGRFDDSLEKYKEVLEIKPDFGVEIRIAYIYALQEDYSEVLKWIDRYISQAPSSGIKAEGHGWKGFYLSLLGNLEAAMGEMHQADILTESVGNLFRRATIDFTRAYFCYHWGRLEQGIDYLDNAQEWIKTGLPQAKTFFETHQNFFSGLVAVKQGRIDYARARLDELLAVRADLSLRQKRWIDFYSNILSAETLFTEGAYEESIETSKKISLTEVVNMDMDEIFPYNLPYLSRDVAPRAYLKLGDMDKAIIEYEDLIILDLKRKNRPLINPRFHYELAKLYDKKGQSSEAVKEYEKFLELWKYAAPGLPEVEDAKKRLTALQE
jgi:serine/threonine protein kinase/tetratricopeptide (TPR) repeat protein